MGLRCRTFVETKNSFVKKQMSFLKSGIRVGMEVTGGLRTFDLAPVSLILRRRKQSPIPNLSQNKLECL